MADRYLLATQLYAIAGEDVGDNYARSIVFKLISDSMRSTNGYDHLVTLSSTFDNDNRKIYSAEVIPWSSYADQGTAKYLEKNRRQFTVYPPSIDGDQTRTNLQKEAIGTIALLRQSIPDTSLQFICDQLAGYIFGKLSVAISAAEAYALMTQNNNTVDGATQLLYCGEAVDSMYITGSVVHVEGGGANYGYIEAQEYDDVMLLMAVEAYNKDKGIDPKLTIEDMKKAYSEQNEVFENYANWFHNGGESKARQLCTEVCAERKESEEQLDNMDINELEEYMDNR